MAKPQKTTPKKPRADKYEEKLSIKGSFADVFKVVKKFSVTKGTIFESSKIPLRTWYAAIYLLTTGKKGISSVQLSEQLHVTQKTAWFLNHRIREMFKETGPDMLEGVVEADETFVGGKNKNRHENKKKGGGMVAAPHQMIKQPLWA